MIFVDVWNWWLMADELQPKLNLTPAQVEQLCAEHDFVEDMIQKLEERRR